MVFLDLESDLPIIFREGCMKKIRYQVSFCTETEEDIIDFIKQTKKTQRHCLFQNALRMFMQWTGYYSRRHPAMIQVGQEKSEPIYSSEKKISENNRNGKKDIIHMFDDYHE